MTRDEEILDKWVCNIVTNSAEQFTATTTKHELLDLIRRVRLDEREACAKCVDEIGRDASISIYSKSVCMMAADAIRNRKDTP